MAMLTKVPWRHFAWIVLVASVVRGGVLWGTKGTLTADPDAYREIARCLAIHGVFGLSSSDPQSGLSQAVPTAFRPPLYPWLLSLLADSQGRVSTTAVAAMHWVLGIATVAGTYPLSRRLFSHTFPTASPRRLETAAAVAAGLVAIDPLLLQASALVMTETLAAALVVLTLWSWMALVDLLHNEPPHPALPSPALPSPAMPLPVLASPARRATALVVRAGVVGFALGLAYLCRPTFVVWPLLLAAYLSGLAIHRRRVRPAIAGALLVAGVAIFVAAWTLRNAHHFGKPIWATTHGGYTLLLGNNPSFYRYLRTPGSFGQAWDPSYFFSRWNQRHSADPRDPAFWTQAGPDQPLAPPAAIGEVADDRLAYETAIATIQQHPVPFIHACLWRLVRLHSPLPLRTADRSSMSVIGVATFYGFLLIILLMGVWKIGRRLTEPRWMAAVTLWATLAAVHAIYWTDMRMRAPAVPVLSMLAAAACLPGCRPAAGDSALAATHQSTTSSATG